MCMYCGECKYYAVHVPMESNCLPLSLSLQSQRTVNLLQFALDHKTIPMLEGLAMVVRQIVRKELEPLLKDRKEVKSLKRVCTFIR